METKICSRCGRELPIESFGKRKRSKDGLDLWCKECKSEYDKQYRAEHKEVIDERTKRWIVNNKERYKTIQKKSREKHIEKVKERSKQFRETHKEWYYEWNKKWQNTLAGTANRRIQSYKKMDEDRGFGKDALDFDSEWMIENILLKPCVHCGETDWHKIGCNRLDNTKPHTKDNVEPCCRDCNCKLK